MAFLNEVVQGEPETMCRARQTQGLLVDVALDLEHRGRVEALLRRPAIGAALDLHQDGKGFRILTYGNLHDMGSEPDESKWFAVIHTFEQGRMVSAEKVPFLKRFTLLKS